MALVPAGRYFNSFEAGLAKARLDDEGIMSFVFDTNMSWEGMTGIIPIRLMVDDEDLETALRILAAAPHTPATG
jgi:hypothetical protein